MIFKTFQTFTAVITLRVILMASSLLLCFILLFQFSLPIYAVFVFLVFIIQTVELIRYFSRLEVEMKQFTAAVHYRDFTQSYSIKRSPVLLKELRIAFNEVNMSFQQLNAEKEIQYQHLKMILEMIDTGILSYDQDGEIQWMNESFRKLLALPALKHLSGLFTRNPDLKTLLDESTTGNKRLIKLQTGGSVLTVLTSVAKFKINGKINYLLAVKNINEAVEETETLAWQKLLRVLTHEIMNSVAPITSLAETLKQRIDTLDVLPSTEVLADMSLSIEVIRSRSQGLMKFADTYRSISRITQPSLSVVLIADLFKQIERLMNFDFEQQQVQFNFSLRESNLTLTIDVSLIEQVILNLIINAIDATRHLHEKKIRMQGYLTEQGKVVIEIADNGTGIPVEILDTIFVPFFTTKKDGSGIGLSLSKQIMQLHKGTILVESEKSKGSIFKLVF